MINKKKIALLFGGCSSEYEISLQSAYAVLTHIDEERFKVIQIGITREGEWFYYQGSPERIRDNTWMSEDCIPMVVSQSRELHGIILFCQEGMKSIQIDAAFPVLHGKNGEDGTVQGLFELAGIPVIGCDTLSSALCMDKDLAHRIAEAAGVKVPGSVLLKKNTWREKELSDTIKKLSFPLFVKPVRSGSSFGITKVIQMAELEDAIEQAFLHDDRVVIEEEIAGVEVGCAVLGTDVPVTGEVDEIELSEGFFNYEEKYTLKTSVIHMPARVDRETAERVSQRLCKPLN